MNIRRRLAESIIEKSFKTSVAFIAHVHNMQEYYDQAVQLRLMPDGSLGKEVAKCLDEHQLSLIPGYESHDLKHVLLNYPMSPEGEIRLQAFMIGNGNLSLPSLAILLYGALLLPSSWFTFYQDYQKGKECIAIASWRLEDFAERPLASLQSEIKNPNQLVMARDLNLKSRFAAYATILVGLFGMLACLPFLFSANLANLIGAGLPFVGGTILVAGGLISLSMLSQKTWIARQA
ncbi:hypothetical protein [Croceimicrobium sp.]|uniref:hypothetical protein n=1 Tax=Croceimicrobium sp. TaxID=2828340 RepID=UPI003BAD41FD